MTFTHTPEADKAFSGKEAEAYAQLLGAQHQHLVDGAWGKWSMEELKRTKQIKFRHPPSVAAMLDIAANSNIVHRGWTVSFSLPNVIYCNNAATIATCNVSSVEESSLMAELWGWVDEFRATVNGDTSHTLFADGGKHKGKIFAISSSTIELAGFICSQTPVVGEPYEFAWVLNDHSLAHATGGAKAVNAREVPTPSLRIGGPRKVIHPLDGWRMRKADEA